MITYKRKIMKRIYLLGLLVTGLFSNCSNEDIVDNSQSVKGNYVIDATIGKTGARTAVDAEFNVQWCKADQIGVYGSTSANVPFTLIGDGGSASGQFAGTFTDDAPVYAYYPYSSDAAISDKALTMTLPSTYAYTSDSNGPMVATYVDKSLSFKHLCGLLKVTVNKIPETATQFILTGSSAIAGKASVADITVAGAALKLSETDEEVSKTITVSLSEAVANDKDFYFPLPVGTYETLTIALCDKDNNTLYTQTANSVVVARAEAVKMPVLDANVWDGKSSVEPKKSADGVYQITTAAELAWFQSKDIPVSTKGSDLSATMTVNAKLCADIDLGDQPWMGMVLGQDVTFDGDGHTICNVHITEHALTEQSIYSPEACVGLFAATKPGSQIKNVTVDGFKVTGRGADAKWSGALVGYSNGTTLYENCHAKNVTIESTSYNSYRIGGLIGFIGSTSTDVNVTNCSAEHITITGAYSLGGLIGSIQGNTTNARTITNCSVVEPITIKQNENSSAFNGGFVYNGTNAIAYYYAPKDFIGGVSKFIGDVTGVLVLTRNTAPTPFIPAELEAFGYNEVVGGTVVTRKNVVSLTDEVRASMKAEAIPSYYTLQDASTPLLPASVGATSVTLDGTKLTAGTDYNRFTLVKDTWNGKAKTKPKQNDGGVYQITTAAELAWFQSATAPNEENKENLEVTVDNDALLCVDIDLANHPWLGMVIKGKKFDGGNHTISNLNMSEYILNQQETTFTPEACIGLFAAVYGASTIENITLDGVTIKPSSEKSPKWVGSLVGFSEGTGTVYNNCIAKNVEIFTHGTSSYRVGGLIGYIEGSRKTTEATATLTDCKVETASIAASFSYGGLVGSLYDSVTFTGCSTSGITLALNGDCTANLGYVSKFIGDVANTRTEHSRTIIIDNCSADNLTEEDQEKLFFASIAGQQGKSGKYAPGSPFVGIVDVADQMTIMVDGETLQNGVGYNRYVSE